MRLIDADAIEKKAYEDLHFHAEIEDWEFDLVNHYLDLAKTIDAAPVVHAEWVTETIDKNERKICVSCSECEAFFTLDLFDYGLCYNYCPSCGAKMDGGGGDEL